MRRSNSGNKRVKLRGAATERVTFRVRPTLSIDLCHVTVLYYSCRIFHRCARRRNSYRCPRTNDVSIYVGTNDVTRNLSTRPRSIGDTLRHATRVSLFPPLVLSLSSCCLSDSCGRERAPVLCGASALAAVMTRYSGTIWRVTLVRLV